MKTDKLIIILLVCFLNTHSFSQKEYCSDLIYAVKKEKEFSESVTCYLSDFLISVDYIRIGNSGFVIAKFRQNKYDFTGVEYVFCGISEERWKYFKRDGIYYSWGKSFHTYIFEFACDCK